MTATTVSVALATYNGERFVREQLESILGQTVPPLEVVVSDDGSTDRTLEVVRDTAASTATTVRILENAAPIGVAANFASAIAACTGEVIVLSDQDDVWHPDRIGRMLAAFDADPELLLLHGDADLVDADGASLSASLFQALEVSPALQAEVHNGRAFNALMRRNFVTGATTAFRRRLADLALPVPDGWLHDEWLAIVASAVGRIDLTPERLIDYRQHGQNQVGVRKLSLVGKFGRMVEPGTERSVRLLARAESLATRLPELPPVPRARVDAALAKLAHERMRSRLRRNRLARVGPVLRELATGRYRRFGRGAADGVRDVLQPLARVDR